jgi:hypothetical protein
VKKEKNRNAYIILTKMVKVINRSNGEKWPNLVTLLRYPRRNTLHSYAFKAWLQFIGFSRKKLPYFLASNKNVVHT